MREMRLAKREITDPEVLKEIVEECDTVRLWSDRCGRDVHCSGELWV